VTTSSPGAPRILIDRAGLDERVGRLAAEIGADHPDGVVLVGVLKGALLFLSDLARALADQGVPVVVDFLAISRYAPDTGRVRILEDLAVEVEGRDVILVEDLVDTGLTLAYLTAHVRERSPRTVEVCALLDRTPSRIVPLEIRYVGESIPDLFVVGYGMHFRERYRNLPIVVDADRATLAANPDAYLALYGKTLPDPQTTEAGRSASG
jgi:hypoxanthine phosphoribosyltransferase